MALYLESQLQANQRRVTTFKSQECFITFYKESDYDIAGKTRADMDPVGAYLFYWGFTLDEQDAGLSALQAFGSCVNNQRGTQRTESKLSISGLYTQESDLEWLLPGHAPLLIFIDMIDDTTSGAGNVYDENNRVVQTLVIRDARISNRRLGGQDQGSVTYDLDFSCGRVHRLTQTTMDFTGDPLPTPPIPGTGAVGGSVVLIDAGYGTSFGSTYGA